MALLSQQITTVPLLVEGLRPAGGAKGEGAGPNDRQLVLGKVQPTVANMTRAQAVRHTGGRGEFKTCSNTQRKQE